MVYRKRNTKRNKNTRKTRRLRGGMISSPAAYPQGSSWSSQVKDWPGVNGNASQNGNYFSYNSNVNEWPVGTNNIAKIGGTRRKKYMKHRKNKRSHTKKNLHNRKHKMRRGGSTRNMIMPQFLVNSWRGLEYTGNQFVNAWKGVPAPTSPMPSEQTLQGTEMNYRPLNIDSITSQADATVSKL